VNRFLYLLIFCLSASLGLAQEAIPLGTWRLHVSFFKAEHILPAGSQVVAAAANGLVIIPGTSQKPEALTRLNGLSDTGISALGWHEPSQTIIACYTSGNIDLIGPQQINNLRGIVTANILGSRQINAVLTHQSNAYLCADFGLVVVNIAQPGLREVYRNLGMGGTALSLTESAIFQDSLWVATPQGIIAGSLSPQVNLADFSQWKRFAPDSGLPAGAVSSITLWQNEVYAALSGQDIYRYTAGQWQPTGWAAGQEILSLRGGHTHLVVVTPAGISKITAQGTVLEIENELLRQPMQAFEAANGALWVADKLTGPLAITPQQAISFAPSGPFSDQIYKLAVFGDKVFALPGGRSAGISPLGNRLGYYSFEKGQWTNHNEYGLSQPFPDFRDIMDAWPVAGTSRTWFASFGDGLLWQEGSSTHIINDQTPGSPLQNALAPNRYVQISSLLHDGSGLWITNHGVNQSLHYLKNDGVWESWGFAPNAARYPLGMVLVARDKLWLRLNPDFGGGILTFDRATGESRLLGTEPNQGNLPDRNVNTMIIDRKGQVWVGTDRGVVYFTQPANALGAVAVNGIRPIFENRALLRDEKITALRSDGGNRKWIGTVNGLWLFSENGERLIHHFTTANSPLLSNHIVTIDLDEKSGEVFIGTKAGIISYRGTGTTGSALHQGVKIFPNPVRPEFQGLVGITGLANGALVKITDVSGKLVYEGKAEGSTFAWNVADLQGRRVASGMYFVWSTTEGGTDSFVGKIAIIN
jgi:ligand-binding sensor domain-containing protein